MPISATSDIIGEPLLWKWIKIIIRAFFHGYWLILAEETVPELFNGN